jgi:tetratricopeptide (TPR) repeat protein
VGLYAKAIEKKPDYAAAYFNRGVAYYNAARYELAKQDFDWAVDQESSDPLALDLRGKTNLMLRDHDSALADFNRALELNPSDAMAMAGRGSALFRKGQYPEALSDLTAAIAQRPLAETYDLRAQVYRALHRTAEADADARQAAQLRPR